MPETLAQSKVLRVVLCTTPGVYADSVLQGLVTAPQLRLVGIVHSSRILRKKGWRCRDALVLMRRTGLRYAVYLWTVTSLYRSVRWLVHHDPVRQYLRRNRVPILTTRDLNNPEGLAFICNCNPDLVLTAHFNQLVGPEVLTLAQQGGLNIHPGTLPAYKGVDPVIWALSRGEQQLGVTVHRLDQVFDAGPVVAASSVPAQPGQSLVRLNLLLFRRGIQLVRDIVTVADAIPPGSPQEGADGYDSWPSPATVILLKKTGRKLASVLDFLAIAGLNSVKYPTGQK